MTIVVGHLTTPEGQAALAAALDEARQRSTPLVVVASGKAPEDEREAGIAALQERLAGSGADFRIEQGGDDLADDLVRLATETAAELVVIGLRRRSPVGKLILGAGAQRILIEAPCPVLAVKV
jgi:nucleotide-binding universal stress UspA family protein